MVEVLLTSKTKTMESPNDENSAENLKNRIISGVLNFDFRLMDKKCVACW